MTNAATTDRRPLHLSAEPRPAGKAIRCRRTLCGEMRNDFGITGWADLATCPACVALAAALTSAEAAA